MALKFHYNKTTIQLFGKQLAIREKALPILKNKENALRVELKTLQVTLRKLKSEKNKIDLQLEQFKAFWEEFPPILVLKKLELTNKKIVGVKVPALNSIEFRMADICWWHFPAWIPAGLEILKKSVSLEIKLKVLLERQFLLNAARKKTTQKVNLYEKVQIPEYADAIRKIKRFLEDKDNISKAAQKIMKKQQERRATA